jgi:hypothetical protein
MSLLARASLVLLIAGLMPARLGAQDAVLPYGPQYGFEGDESLGDQAALTGYRPEQPWFPSAEPAGPVRPGLQDRIVGAARGRLQLEGGYAFLSDATGGVRTTQHALPDLLVRYGLTDRLEVRLGWPGYVATRYDGPLSRSSSDDVLEPNVGFMFDLWPQRGIVPQTAALAAVPITLEGNPFALDGLQPLAQLLYRWQLTDRVAWGGTTGMALFDVRGDHFVQLQQTVNVDYLLTCRLGIFGEWEMLVDHGSASDGAQHMLGGGVSRLLTERTQLTWKAGLGLNDAAPDFLTDIRLAYRL